MTKLEAIGLAACLAVAVGGCRTTGSVADFVPDGRTGDAIQRAIDAANAAGGGRVTLERGIYESGTIYLKSHVELHIPEGAVLRGAARPEDYDDVDDPRITKAPEKSKKASSKMCAEISTVKLRLRRSPCVTSPSTTSR